MPSRMVSLGAVQARIGLLLACVSFLAATLASCRSHQAKIEKFTEAWASGDYAVAESEIDLLLAKEAGCKPEEVAESRGLADTIDPGKGDTSLLLMEKAMVRLAHDDLDSCIDLLRRSRDVLEARFNESDVGGYLQSALSDDAALDFSGADYEHLLIPTLLSIVDLLNGGQDAYAYALQVGEKQEMILGSTFGESMPDPDAEQEGATVSYNPRKQYRRLSVGAYVEGILRESESYRDDALKAYSRAREWGCEAPALVEACSRTSGETAPQPGTGTVHVFYFGGRGPRLVKGTSPVTQQALALAYVGSALIGSGVGVLGQTPVPVPIVQVGEPYVPPLTIESAGGVTTSTGTILDLNEVANQQLEANMPWILARAAIRRAVKAIAAKAAQDAASQQSSSFGLLAGLVANIAMTAGERAETRNWTTLPAQIQVARIDVAEGLQELALGMQTKVSVRVAAGKHSFVVVLQPNLSQPPRVIVDKYSKAPPPEQASETIPEPATAAEPATTP